MRKLKATFYCFMIVVLFLFLINWVFKAIETPGRSMYNYSDTKKTKLNGIVTNVQISRHTEIDVDDIYYNLMLASRTKNLENHQNNNFVLKGDSIIKNANNDTFTIIRDRIRYTYILP